MGVGGLPGSRELGMVLRRRRGSREGEMGRNAFAPQGRRWSGVRTRHYLRWVMGS